MMQEKEKQVYTALLRLYFELDVTLEEFDELVRAELARGIELSKAREELREWVKGSDNG